MAARSQGIPKWMMALAFAMPCVIAVAIPLYLSGSPAVSPATAVPAGVAPTSTARTIAAVPATATAGAASVVEPTVATIVEPEPTATTRPAAEKTVLADETLALQDAIDPLIAETTGVYGLMVTDETGEVLYSLNPDLPFQAASLYKLVLLADFYAGIESGAVAPDLELWLQPEYFPLEGEPEDSYFDASWVDSVISIDEALFATGAYSSNVAARALLSITDADALQAMARRIGMDDTYFFADPTALSEWPPEPKGADPDALDRAVSFVEAQGEDGPINITTPRDIATYYAALLGGDVVSPEVSATILDILSEQVVDDRFPCFLPPGTAMAHKTGNLDHVVHDAGIIWNESGPVVLVAMVEDPEDDLIATWAIQRLALIAYDSSADVPALPTDNGTPVAYCNDGTPS